MVYNKSHKGRLDCLLCMPIIFIQSLNLQGKRTHLSLICVILLNAFLLSGTMKWLAEIVKQSQKQD